MKLNIYILIALSFVLNLNTKAQKKDTLKSDVTVIRAYDPTISDANKITLFPTINDTTKIAVDFKYYVDAEKADAEFEIIPINSAKMLPEPLSKLYRSNLTLGYGNYNTPLAEYSYSSLRSKDNNLAIHLKHLSSSSSLNLENYSEKIFAGFSENIAEIHSKSFINTNSTILSGISFNRNVYQNYGFFTDSLPKEKDSIPKKEDYRQRYWNVDANIRYLSNYTDNTHLNYDAGIRYNYLENLQKGVQHTVEFDGNFNQYNKKELLAADIFIGTYSFLQDTLNNMRVNIGVKPYVKVGNKNWALKAGLDFIADTYDQEVKYHFYPNVKFHYNTVEDFLTPYIGINGKKQSNNYAQIIQENPFISNNLLVQNTNNVFNVYGGFRGKVSKSLQYNFSVNYSKINGMYFFVNDTSTKYENTFIVEYDNVKLTTLKGEILWAKSDKLSFLLKGEYFQYKLDSLLKPWHKPEYLVTLSTKYNLRDKILVNFDIFAISDRFAKNFYNKTTPIKLKATIDINLGLEYRYNKLWSAFVKLNNIGAYKYYQWNQYPTQRFNAMAGLSYSF